jgi:Raf kinase inhibitor-like YbhB/YbcL family protein
MRVPQASGPAVIRVVSDAFTDGGTIPRDYTCRGAGGFPAITWQGVPGTATSVALVVSDPDAPKGTFVHWVLYDLPGADGRIQAGTVPAGAREADNSAGKQGWFPPCPPSGTHHYVFTVYALDARVSGGSTQDVLDDIDRRAIASGTLTGLVASG